MGASRPKENDNLDSMTIVLSLNCHLNSTSVHRKAITAI